MSEIIGFLLVINILISLVILIKIFSKKEIGIQKDLELIEKSIQKGNELTLNELRSNRVEMKNALDSANNILTSKVIEMTNLQASYFDNFYKQINTLTKTNEEKVDKLRETVEERLAKIQEDNNKKLEEMRKTVDDKLHVTLEQRLGDSFKLVSERLEQVHKGLGEMQALASNVGDLKKILGNVKTRGTLGEIQLGSIIEQILIPEQYEKNFLINKTESRDIVEYAIKIPTRSVDGDKYIYLPIDAKFPVESYERLISAYEQGNSDEILIYSKELEKTIKENAKKIKEKYIIPPITTDFAILFLPTEGLYAEIIKKPGLFESIQRDYRVIIAGPTTISAILNSLQIGFRTFAIEKRTTEVFEALISIRKEFQKFGETLDKVKTKLNDAQKTIDEATKRKDRVERELNKVERLPSNYDYMPNPETNE
ncbi:DNA recombination protein RmuC [Caldicellulosiruptoraceae bacterium PP1]